MKINQLIIRAQVLIFSSLLLIACSHNPNEEGHHDSHQDETGLQLDNGQKWKADEKTIEHIGALKNLISENPIDGDESKYRPLAKQLFMEFKMVFDDCTMTGEAHEQLHTYLTPLHKKISKLVQGKSENPDEELAEIEAHLLTFDDYFE